MSTLRHERGGQGLSYNRHVPAPIHVVPYDPSWPARFAMERAALARVLAPWLHGPIEHIGSTSIPGMGAKPIIDIMIGLHRLDDAVECIPRLDAIGHKYHPEFEDRVPDRRFFRKGPDWARTAGR